MARLLRTAAELEAFAPNWERLWLADPHATPFQHPAWLLPWWRQFGEGALLFVVIETQEDATGLLPFYIYQEQVTGERKLMLLGVGITDYLDGVFAAICSDADIVDGLQVLLQERGWDTLVALQLSPASRLLAALRRISGEEPFQTESCCRMPAVTVDALPQKIRRNAMYYRNRAAREGRLDYILADERTCVDAFNALQRTHTARWHSSGEPGVLADERVLAWHREAVPLLVRAGVLRLGSLQLNGEPLGILYSLVDPPGRAERRQYFYLTAYSVAHAELRPGTLLLAYAIEHAAREGVQVIDMLRGEESYKSMWHLERTPTYGISLAYGQPST